MLILIMLLMLNTTATLKTDSNDVDLAELVKTTYYSSSISSSIEIQSTLRSENGMLFILLEKVYSTWHLDSRYNADLSIKPAKKEDDPFKAPISGQQVIMVDFTDTHSLLLNRFPYLDQQILLVTKEFENQTDVLNKNDFEAAVKMLDRIQDFVIYFNGGPNAGNTQPHKHLQGFPQSVLHQTNGRLPLTIAINESIFSNRVKIDRENGFMLPQYDFAHQIRLMPIEFGQLPFDDKLDIVLKTYNEIYKNLELAEGSHYNLILTNDYMMIAKRKCRSFDRVTINTLWFMGIVFCSTPDIFAHLAELGILEVLKYISADL